MYVSVFLDKFCKRFSNNVKRISNNTVMRRRKLFNSGVKRTKSSVTRFSGPDANYGLAKPLENFVTDKELNKIKKEFLIKLAKVDRSKLEQMTKNQIYSQDWFNERKKRLTASNLGEIYRM